jgi:hypothetical protein
MSSSSQDFKSRLTSEGEEKGIFRINLIRERKVNAYQRRWPQGSAPKGEEKGSIGKAVRKRKKWAE